uniref:Uncharacterized protein n=1 Tax=Avena sativa TaxID=4498 RepID=A0ACD5VJ34_AVESA
MYGETEPAAATERTAFRQAEKKYKLYKPPSTKGRSQSVAKEAVRICPRWWTSARCLLAASSCPLGSRGFYFIPGALSTEEQCYWIRESLKTFPQPPNRTNLTALYGPIFDLLTAAKNQKILLEVPSSDGQESTEQNNSGEKTHSINFKFVEHSEIEKGETLRSAAATSLVRKLRWSTLGLQFDWSKRNYDVSLPHNNIPDALSTLAKKMAIPAMPSGVEFSPEAAIVNYYGPSDMLGGHVDDMEADWTKPIVSISLGCKCIFLLGGKTRDEVPRAMFLRSGDIVLMAGEARERFHGVPRIFTESPARNLWSGITTFW